MTFIQNGLAVWRKTVQNDDEKGIFAEAQHRFEGRRAKLTVESVLPNASFRDIQSGVADQALSAREFSLNDYCTEIALGSNPPMQTILA
jgi:hypothetical protein